MTAFLSRRNFIATTAGAAVALALGSCGDDADDAAVNVTSSTTDPSVSGARAVPANDEDALKALFDPMFEPLGQHVTRVGLYDLAAGFVLDDEGDHLAIYVEPIDPEAPGWDDARYIESLAPGMAACTPFIFETWSGVASMDLCQEPPQARAPEREPPIETQVLMGRADAALIDWETVDLADLIGARVLSPETVRVSARPGLDSHPLWVAAEVEGPKRVGLA